MGTEPAGPPRLALLASPLLGPAVWAPVARELEARGHAVLVPPPYVAVRTPADVLEHLVAALPAGEPLVLAPHSNAGLYAAALAAERDVRGIVFVDALLPPEGAARPAEPAFRAFLAGLAGVDGLLPGWTHWWPEEEVRALVPDDAVLAAIESEQQRLPLSYFDAEVPAPVNWQRLPVAYLSFGETYAREQAAAEAAGWPVQRLDGRHLHPLVDPVGVASALEGLLGRMGPEGR